MEQVFIIGESVGIWERIKSLLLSDNMNDVVLANELIDEHNFPESAKDIIVEHLNTTYKGHHFFIENCRIRRTGYTLQ